MPPARLLAEATHLVIGEGDLRPDHVDMITTAGALM
jgi:hypothetical protein